ncbi:MAG: hypothetical protein Q8S73_16820 [Deltaproteobacteria bacterium]|nr:hypothetical protein [Myxococcales bacterium]MDP3215772.1 hypothetical protein [Deltaproteobacteria bacterium]
MPTTTVPTVPTATVPTATVPTAPPAMVPPRFAWISLVDAGLRITAAVLNFLSASGGHH